MSLDFVNNTSTILKIQRRDMVEKDLLLHQILINFSEDKFLSKNLLFKGGTCLIKGYLGYLRFSEDIDFTWKEQSRFIGKTTNSIRNYLKSITNRIGTILESLAKKRGLDFKFVKTNKNYVEFGGSNKTCTFKIWYHSKVLNKRSFIKIQINFVEEICSKSRKGRLKSLLKGKHDDLSLFPEYQEYSQTITFTMYNIREILSEKIRALLTREGIKARDFVDIFFIKQKGIKPESVEKCVLKKTNHALRLYSKYRTNLQTKMTLLEQDAIFEWGEERNLILSDLNEQEFYRFIEDFKRYLKILVRKLIIPRRS